MYSASRSGFNPTLLVSDTSDRVEDYYNQTSWPEQPRWQEDSYMFNSPISAQGFDHGIGAVEFDSPPNLPPFPLVTGNCQSEVQSLGDEGSEYSSIPIGDIQYLHVPGNSWPQWQSSSPPLSSLSSEDINSLVRRRRGSYTTETNHRKRASLSGPSTRSSRSKSPINMKCTRGECDKSFTVRCQLQRHLDNHDKPFKCPLFDCKRSFGSSSDLERHRREVHEKDDQGSLYPCPEPTCKRNKNGFSRRWNLQDHCKRIHGKDLSEISSNLERDSSPESSPYYSRPSSPDSAGSAITDTEMYASSQNSESSVSVSEQRRREMQADIENLENQKRGIDDEIQRLKLAISSLDSKFNR